MERFHVRFPLVAVILALGGGCNGDGGGGGGGIIDPPPGSEPVATVTVTAPAGALVAGQTKQLTVVLKDAAGAELTDRTITLSSSSEAIARVSDTGLVTAVGPGRATITATSETKTGTVAVDVGEGGLIGPAGGTIAAFGGAVRLEVPAGALAAPTAITVSRAAALPPDPILVGGSGVILGGPQGTTFAAPAQLRIGYGLERAPSGVAEADFRLHRLTGGNATSLDGTVDPAGDTVTAGIIELGTYAAGRAEPATACTAPEHRQFDFWVGEWTVMIAGFPNTPPSSITDEPSGCAIFENFNNGAGKSINVFNPVDEMWHQTFVFSNGQRLILVGELVGDEMILLRVSPPPLGPAGSFERWTWTQLTEGRVRQLQEVSNDGGLTVGPAFDGTYVPR